MTTDVNEIRSVNWQLSVNGVGDVAEALDDIRQAIGLALTTTRGSDPLRPEYGSNIYQYIDKPVNTAAPNIVREILQTIDLWERRVRVRKIEHYVDGHVLGFEITVQLIANSETTGVLFEIDRSARIATVTDRDRRAHSMGFSFGYN